MHVGVRPLSTAWPFHRGKLAASKPYSSASLACSGVSFKHSISIEEQWAAHCSSMLMLHLKLTPAQTHNNTAPGTPLPTHHGGDCHDPGSYSPPPLPLHPQPAKPGSNSSEVHLCSTACSTAYNTACACMHNICCACTGHHGLCSGCTGTVTQ